MFIRHLHKNAFCLRAHVNLLSETESLPLLVYCSLSEHKMHFLLPPMRLALKLEKEMNRSINRKVTETE
jgi:hypothetical protein